MKIDLVGKTALVTASTSGIGLAIARSFVEAGASVILNGRTAEQVSKATSSVTGALSGVAADLATAEGAETLIAAVPRPDIVVCNFGIYEPVGFFEADDAVWDRHWQANVMSAVRLARAYLPSMRAEGWGRLILLGSSSAFNVPTGMIHYGVSKIADVALARGLAKLMAGTDVTVNSVLPGPTLSDGLKTMLRRADTSGRPMDEIAAEFVRKAEPASITGRPASVEEVANIVTYLASPLSSATTGSALRVDGGAIDTLM